MKEKTQSPFDSLTREELIVRAEQEAAALLAAVRELAFQNEEKAKWATKLVEANKQLAVQYEENLQLHEQIIQAEKMKSLRGLAVPRCHFQTTAVAPESKEPGARFQGSWPRHREPMTDSAMTQ